MLGYMIAAQKDTEINLFNTNAALSTEIIHF
jgi:hypothetical protein